MTDISVDLLQSFTIFFDKKSAATCANISDTYKVTGIDSVNQHLVDQLYQRISKTLGKL